MDFRVTARYGHRYHLITVEAADAAEALRRAAELLPPEILPRVDLVELRLAVDPEARPIPPGGEGG